MSLEFDGPVPLHIQLKKLLKDEIIKGYYKKKIPSERELMDRYSLSRTTVRLAVSELVHEGILEKRHGKGTFISSISVQDWLGSFRSFTETVQDMDMNPDSQLLFHGKKSSPDKIKELLEVDEFYLIERLRFADDLPLAIERHYYPLEIGNQLKRFDLNSAVLYDLLESTLGISLWKAKQKITSGQPSKQDADYLRLDDSSSVLQSERLISDPNGKPVEFLRSSFRPDMYSFSIEMMRTRE
ncbi:GntR family transcriptional regulator [Halobacillus shinanisalinarum]|uniref:GntR family transcriptional regulator n=1 Tax=Halobacillus shinanisalinarum TaxID=2932258 RepID=A0ABY4GVU8_9BACI|nr:GntR family transcriptional regulator [Halobacillus shinanisalinarum]UOQ92291.1 GntR family transcriptional regulator [Halobacillus shinanisalinarum]